MWKQWQSWFNSYANNEHHISWGKTKNFKSGNLCYQMYIVQLTNIYIILFQI